MEKLNGGGGRGGGFHWAGLPQLPVHRSQWKFIFLIGHIRFRVRLDSMLKLIRNYINPNGFAVQVTLGKETGSATWNRGKRDRKEGNGDTGTRESVQ